MKRLIVLTTALVVAGTLACPAPAGSVTYLLTDLGTLGGRASRGSDINNSGQVTGSSETTLANEKPHAFFYSDGLMTDIGTLGGTRSAGSAINDSGQVTGTSTLTGDVFQRAFLYSNGEMTDIGTLGGNMSSGYGINYRGQITGSSFTAGGDSQPAFLYTNGSMVSLGTLSTVPWANSIGRDVNNSGEVVGYSDSDNNYPHAFLYRNGTMADLGTLGGLLSRAYSINDSGQIAGHSEILDSTSSNHAFLYSNSTMIDLGTLGGKESYAYGINNSGQVVGEAYTADRKVAFLYSNGTMVDLNTLIDPRSPHARYITLTQAVAINDNGWIVANGYDASIDADHAFLLKLNLVDPPPTVSLSASPTDQTAGEPITLAWGSTRASSCTASGGATGDGWAGAKATSGTLTLTESVSGIYAYELLCTSQSGSASAQISVTFTVPTVSLSAIPGSLSAGDFTLLTWNSSNAVSCTASGGVTGDGWAGPKGVAGTMTVNIAVAGTHTFLIVCNSGSRSAQAQATVSVTKPKSSSGGGAIDLLALTLLAGLLRRGHISISCG